LQLGACYIMLGQQEKAMTVFNKLLNLSGKKSHFDPVVIRQTKRYVACGGYFAAFELLYLRRDLAKMIPIIGTVLLALDAMASQTRALEPVSPKQPSVKTPTESKRMSPFGGFKHLASGALSNLNQLTGVKKKDAIDYSSDDRASYLLIKGSILKAQNKQEEAMECFKEVISLQDILNEKLYLPYCLYELGECYYIQGQLKEAEENMRKCSKISGYDWEDPLKIRLKVTMDQLKKRNKGTSSDSLISIDAMVGNSSDDEKIMDEPKSDDEEDDEKKIKEVESDD